MKAFDAVTANNARGDAAGFGRLVTEGFVAIGTDGKLLTRDERMRQIGSSPPPATHIPSGAREDASTRVHGDIAVSTFVPPAAAGRPRLRQTVVHVRQGGAWRRAAIASTVVQSGK